MTRLRTGAATALTAALGAMFVILATAPTVPLEAPASFAAYAAWALVNGAFVVIAWIDWRRMEQRNRRDIT